MCHSGGNSAQKIALVEASVFQTGLAHVKPIGRAIIANVRHAQLPASMVNVELRFANVQQVSEVLIAIYLPKTTLGIR